MLHFKGSEQNRFAFHPSVLEHLHFDDFSQVWDILKYFQFAWSDLKRVYYWGFTYFVTACQRLSIDCKSTRILYNVLVVSNCLTGPGRV